MTEKVRTYSVRRKKAQVAKLKEKAGKENKSVLLDMHLR